MKQKKELNSKEKDLEKNSNGLRKNISEQIIKNYTDIDNTGSFTSVNTFVKKTQNIVSKKHQKH